MNGLILFLVVALSVLAEAREAAQDVESRGKGKYALLMHFFYVVATKFFILKVIYAIIFYVILTKGWHFALWFIQYLKQEEHPYIEHDYHHDYHGHHGYHEHDHHAPVYPGHQSPYQAYEYKYIPTSGKEAYDADGSFSVQSKHSDYKN